MITRLPPWVESLRALLPASVRLRASDGGVLLRAQKRVFRARPVDPDDFLVRSRLPDFFPPLAGVMQGPDLCFGIEEATHGKRIDRAPGELTYQRLAHCIWSLHAAGYTPGDIELQRMMLTDSGVKLLNLPGRGDESRAAMALAWSRAFITGRKATAGMRADKLAPLVLRVLGGESALPAMLRAKLECLPDALAWRTFMNTVFDEALVSKMPCVIAVANAEQGAAVRVLVCEAASTRRASVGDGLLFAARRQLRLIGPTTPADCERRLGRLSPGPTLAIVTGANIDVSRKLEHVGRVVPPVQVSARGLFEWLRPLRAEASRVAEDLVPALTRDPAGARSTIAALIERAGANWIDEEPALSGEWVKHWRKVRERPTALGVLHADAARTARLIALSNGGLNAEGLQAIPELARGLALLQDIGSVLQRGVALQLADGSRVPAPDVASRRADLIWLSEREHLAPDPEPLRRTSWRVGLRMRAGDLSCWQDERVDELFNALVGRKEHELALQLLESHAAGSVRTDTGPPSIEALYAARDLGLGLWRPQRVRRVIRMWLRNYRGEFLALGLALQAYVERRIGGVNAYMPSVEHAESILEGLPRFAREQALIELAMCVCNDDPDRALGYISRVSARPARNAAFLCESRILMVRADCEFVAVRPEESLRYLQQARDAISPRANAVRRARIEGELEIRQINAFSMTQFYRVELERLLEPLRNLHAEHACLADLVSAAIVSDRLMRMRLHEVGASTPEQIDSVLAEARIDNLRGYLIAVFQLEENALYRGEFGIARQLTARMDVLNRGGEHNHAVYSAWCRHEAIMDGIRGSWSGALKLWSSSRTWHMPEPWRFRTNILRYGEWSFLLMLAGKYRRARVHAHRVFKQAAQMSAGSRASPYFVISVCADLLLGEPVNEDDRETLGHYVRKSYALPGLLQRVLDAADGNLDWSSLAERVQESEAPPFWKCCMLSVAAVVAKRRRSGQADSICRAARDILRPEWGFLHGWLQTEFPAPEKRGDELSPRALRALVDMQLPQDTDEAGLVELLAQSAETAVEAEGVLLQFGLNGSSCRRGNAGAELENALERALLGDEVIERGLFAVGLGMPFGALAVRTRLKREEVLPALQALAHRLSEMQILREARATNEARRARAREAVRAAWAIASADHGLPARLSALRDLLQAELGARSAELTVQRGAHSLLSTGVIPTWQAETVVPIDATLGLRARINGGDTTMLEEVASKAARAFAGALALAPERLRIELGRPDESEGVSIAGEPAGASPAIRRLHDDLRRYADLTLPVVVTGEPGSGKDLAARGLHSLSARASQPHIVVDCPTLRRETAASELFGHIRGAFTGATHDHIGLLERAGEGTLQVDGIADLDPSIQAMLLRAFQVRTFLPVGGVAEREFRARIIVTSAQPLIRLVEDGRLREDLAQRLQGVGLRVPPLRERGDDAIVIAQHALRIQETQLNRQLRLSPQAQRHIQEYAWPGNVRELKALITRAAVMCEGSTIKLKDLQTAEAGEGQDSLYLPAAVPGMTTTTRVILGTLRQVGESQPGALARRLGLSRTTVSTSLSELARQGLCERLGRGRSTRYRPL